MNLFTFAAICFAIVALFDLVVLRSLRQRFTAADTQEIVGVAPLYAALSYVRTLALVGGFVAAACGVTFWLLVTNDLSTIQQIAGTIDLLQGWYAWIAQLSFGWCLTVVILLAIGSVLMIRARAKAKLDVAFGDVFRRETQRLSDLAERGELRELPPNEVMQAIEAAGQELQAELEKRIRDSSSKQERQYYERVAKEKAEELQQHYFMVDMNRRMNLELDRDVVQLPVARTTWERIRTFFMSEGLVWVTRRGNRLLALTTLALMVPTLFGFLATTREESLGTRIAKLEDLRVGLQTSTEITQVLAAIENPKVAGEEDETDPESVVHQLRATTKLPTQLAQAVQDGRQKLAVIKKELGAIRSRQAARVAQNNAARDQFAKLQGDVKAALSKEGKSTREQISKLVTRVEHARSAAPEEFKKDGSIRSLEARNDSYVEAKPVRKVESEGKRLAADLEAHIRKTRESAHHARELLGASRDLTGGAQEQIASALAALDANEPAVQKRLASGVNTAEDAANAGKEARAQRASSAISKNDLAGLSKDGEAHTKWLKTRPARVEGMSVQLARRGAEAELHALTKATEGTKPSLLSDEDRRMIRRVAQHLETTGPNADFAKSAKVLERPSYTLRADLAREKVLESVGKRLPTERIRRPSMARAPPLNAADISTLKLIETAKLPNKLQTDLGKVIEQELVDAARRSPSFLSRLKQKAGALAKAGASAFASPVTARTLRVEMLGRVTGLLLSESGATVPGAAEESIEDALRQSQRARAQRAVTELAKGGELEAAMSHLTSDPPGRPTLRASDLAELRLRVELETGKFPQPDAVHVKTLGHPPSLGTPLESQVRQNRALELVSQLDTGGAKRNLSGAVETLAGYDDYFPSQISPPSSLQRKSLEQLGVINRKELRALARVAKRSTVGASNAANSKSAFVKGTTKLAKSSSRFIRQRVKSFHRSRSYRRLRGFARVGGVLIGRDPTGSTRASLDFEGLDWEFEGTRARLIVRRKEGAKMTTPWYETWLIEQSLAYAADARPTSVTMVTAPPLAGLRILLHPALVDTPLGHEVTRLDQFVDGCRIPWRKERRAALEVQKDLYGYARVVRLLALAELNVFPRKTAKQLRKALDVSKDVRKSLEGALKSTQALRDPHGSLFIAKKEYYDPKLVAILLDRKRTMGTLDGLRLAVSEDANRAWRSALKKSTQSHISAATQWCKSAKPDWFSKLNSDVKAYNTQVKRRSEGAFLGLWTESRLESEGKRLRMAMSFFEVLEPLRSAWSARPSFQPWSGVREEDFPLVRDRVVPSAGDNGEVRFMIQVAFRSLPYFLNGAWPTNDKEWAKVDDHIDEKPWLFKPPPKGGKVHELVSKSVLKQKAKSGSLSIATDFIRIQRFFRMAFGGRLGSKFPVEKLAELAGDLGTRGSIPHYRTKRWNPNPRLALARVRNAVAQASEEREGDTNCTEMLKLIDARLQRIKAFRVALKLARNGKAPARAGSVGEFRPVSAAGVKYMSWVQDDWAPKVLAISKKIKSDSSSPSRLSAALNALELRHALGVLSDEVQGMEESAGLRGPMTRGGI